MTVHSPLQRNNVHISHAPQGKGTIVFGHGFGTDQTAWEKVAAAFQEDFTLVLYDNVGAGKSDLGAYSPVRYRSLQAYADDLLEICEALSLRQVYFVGHSMSSMIGLLAAIKSPDTFQKMVFVGGSPRYLNEEGYFGGFVQEEIDQLYRAMQENYFLWASGFVPLAMANLQTPDLAAFFHGTLSAIRPDICLEVAKVIFQSDWRAALPQLKLPVLVVQSRQDPVVPREVALYLHAHLPDNQLAEVEAEGHLPHVSKPEAVIKVLREFLQP